MILLVFQGPTFLLFGGELSQWGIHGRKQSGHHLDEQVRFWPSVSGERGQGWIIISNIENSLLWAGGLAQWVRMFAAL